MKQRIIRLLCALLAALALLFAASCAKSEEELQAAAVKSYEKNLLIDLPDIACDYFIDRSASYIDHKIMRFSLGETEAAAMKEQVESSEQWLPVGDVAYTSIKRFTDSFEEIYPFDSPDGWYYCMLDRDSGEFQIPASASNAMVICAMYNINTHRLYAFDLVVANVG